MKKTRLLISCAMTAAITFTACSGGGGTTTAAPGTTAPGTSASTTAAATTSAATTTPLTTPSTTAAQTTAPATQPATMPATTSASGTGSGVADAFLQSYKSLEELDSYRVTTTSKSMVFGNEMVSTTVMDVFPKTKQYRITTEVAGMSTQSYMMDDRMYTQMPDGSWGFMKLDEPEVPPSEAIGEIPDVDFEDMFTQETTADGYIIRTKRPLSLEEMVKMGTSPGSPGSSALPEGMEELGEDLEITYEMETKLDKNYMTQSTDMKMIMLVEEMEMETDLQMVYSDFDSVEPFTLPQEAENAKEITTPTP